MITVDAFLCLSLETGGLIIGWIFFVGNLLIAAIMLILMILLCIYSCEDFSGDMTSDSLDLCNTLHGVIIGLSVVIAIICVGCAYIGWKCIQGTKARDHFRVKPMMIYLAVSVVLSALQILSITSAGIANGLISLVIDAYFFVVIYSLYNVFKREYESVGNSHTLQHTGKV